MYKLLIMLVIGFVFSSFSYASIDPTKPLFGVKQSSKAVEQQKLVLQSIVVSNGNRKAIVSGQLVQKGDRIEQYKVINIDKNLVKLESSEGQMTLKLFAESVKK